MKSWTDINISKKTMTDNLKISFFNNDIKKYILQNACLLYEKEIKDRINLPRIF